jgi:uncharacterized membrane protein YqjE
MTGNNPDRSKGLLTSLADLAATMLAIVQTRIELLSVELEQERDHVISLLVMSLIALFCFGVGLVLIIIAIVMANWETHRVAALSMISGFFLMAGIAVWVYSRHKLKTKPVILTTTLSELSKDRQQLSSRS